MSPLREKKVAKYFAQHKGILLSVLSVFVLALTLSSLSRNTAFLTGEQVFSFDYYGHVRNIIQDFSQDKNQIFSTNSCIDCPTFFHYSKWYSLINLSVLGIGKLLHLNPFLYYILLSISIQLTAVYYSIKFLLGKVKTIPYLVTSFIFITFPINFSYLGSGLYSFHHSLLIILISFLTYFYKKIDELSLKKVISYGFWIGICSFPILNISIGFLPIFVYTILIITLIFIKKIIQNLSKTILFFLIFIGIPVVLNAPLVLSVIKNGNPYIFPSFISLGFLDSISGGLSPMNSKMVGLSPFGITVFAIAVLFLLLVSKIKIFNKILLITLYVLISLLLRGGSLYTFIFKNLPLFSSLRSLHRVIVFEEIIICIVIYLGLTSIQKYSDIRYKLLTVLVTLALLVPLISFIFQNSAYLNKITVPSEYFQVDKYLDKEEGLKIYFPAYLPWGKSINGVYSWAPDNSKYPTIYQNPFTSLFAMSDLLQTERYPYVTMRQKELRSLLDYQNSPEKIIEAMERHGIIYVIIDNNFLWGQIYPKFKIESIKQLLDLDTKIGSIDIYKTKYAVKSCESSFGKFDSKYCFLVPSADIRPDFLIGANKSDYLLSAYRPDSSEKISIQNGPGVNSQIADPDLASYLISNKISFGDVYTLDNSTNKTVSSVFLHNLKPGIYKLVIPVLKIKDGGQFFHNAELSIHLDGNEIERISPVSEKSGISYEILEFKVDTHKLISGELVGEGSLVIGNPMVIKRDKFEKITTDLLWNPKIVSDDVLSNFKKTGLIINNVEITRNPSLFETNSGNDSVQIDLLDEKLTSKKEITKFTKEMTNGKTLYNTSNGEYPLSYTIKSLYGIKKISLEIGTYFLNHNRELSVKLINPKTNKAIFESGSFFEDLHPRSVEFPDFSEKLNEVEVRVTILDSDGLNLGVNLYKVSLICML